MTDGVNYSHQHPPLKPVSGNRAGKTALFLSFQPDFLPFYSNENICLKELKSQYNPRFYDEPYGGRFYYIINEV